MQKALEIIRKRNPNLIVDGEMQADTAVVPDIAKNIFSARCKAMQIY
jgi:malate dehydrogenase (oxaloacetate-decarboxylating)(NADP+)